MPFPAFCGNVLGGLFTGFLAKRAHLENNGQVACVGLG